MGAAAFVLCWLTRANSLAVSGLGAVWLVILVERFWLLPALDERVNLYLSASPPNISYHHTLFIGFEAFKVVVLLICAIRGLVNLEQQGGGPFPGEGSR